MLIKRSTAEITEVLKDEEHNLDDDGTRKALAEAKKKDLNKTSKEHKNKEDNTQETN